MGFAQQLVFLSTKRALTPESGKQFTGDTKITIDDDVGVLRYEMRSCGVVKKASICC
jgi:hypothetical protein